MNRRAFLASGLALGAVSPVAALAADGSKRAAAGPTLLTVTGAIGRSNRGPLNPALDQMMAKQKVSFDRAYTFDFGALTALPSVSLNPTLEYDAQAHTLEGPLLSDVVAAAGATAGTQTTLLLQAVDGYAVPLALADAIKYRYIVATHLDGKPMALGGLGPLWAVYEPDAFATLTARPLNQRFVFCPWALYRIDVRAA